MAKEKYPARPELIGSKLDWKRKAKSGSQYEDLSAKRVYTNSDGAHKRMFNASVRLDKVLEASEVPQGEESEEFKALKEAAKELTEGMSESLVFMREACLAHTDSWALVKMLEQEEYATDCVEERFSAKRLKKARQAVEAERVKNLPKKGPKGGQNVNGIGGGGGGGGGAPARNTRQNMDANRYGGSGGGGGPNDNDRCYRCGRTGHRSTSCTGTPLPTWRGN